MSVRITGDGYDYTRHLEGFYVSAFSASDASTKAIRIAASGASPRDEYRTSGSVVEVALDTLDPVVGTFGLNERAWDDGTHEAADPSQRKPQ